MKNKELIPVTHRVCRRPDGSIYGIPEGKKCRRGSEDYTTTFRIKRLNDRKDELAKKLIEYLEKPRPDKIGNFMEHPDEKSFRVIDAVGSKVSDINKRINELEGKDLREKRWIDGDPYGLKKYSDFTSVARRNYENEIRRELLSPGDKGNKAVLVLGGPATRKTTLRDEKLGSVKGFVVVDPVAIKGMDPVARVGQALGMRDASALANSNARRLSREIYEEAKGKGLNIAVSGTGAKVDRYVEEIRDLKGRGYRVSVIASHYSPNEGITRAIAMSERTGMYHPVHHVRRLHFTIPADLERLSREADNAIMFDGNRSKNPMEFQSGALVGPVTSAVEEFRRTYGVPNQPAETAPAPALPVGNSR